MDIFVKHKDSKLFFILTIVILFLIISISIIPQKVSHDVFEIKHLKSIYSSKDVYKKDYLDHLSDFVFGNNDIVLKKPISIFVQDTNNYFILDQARRGIIQANSNKNLFSKIFHEREHSSLIDICLINNTELLFTDSKDNKVYLYDLENEKLGVFSELDQLNKPTGIAFNRIKNEIWTIQTGSHLILIFNKKGEVVKSIGQRGNKELEFNFPTYIWIDLRGMVYVVDSMNFRIQILNSEGEFISMFGEQGDATGYFARPKGIATDSYGNIYVVDALFHSVQIFDNAGKFLNYFGSQGKAEKEFWLPQGIFIDKNDRIYVADSYNSRIQIFQLRVK